MSPSLCYKKALRDYFGHSSLRGNQEPVVTNILEGKDVLVTAPTGHGKSLCFQLPALVRHDAAHPQGCVSLVVSPLVALMQNQVAALHAKNIPAALLSSAEDQASNRRVLSALMSSKHLPFALLYITPERLVKDSFLHVVEKLYKFQRIALVAVDEAHCISQWGHDFRTAYAKLGIIKERFPLLPVVALTATATPRVCRDILESLKIQKAEHVHTSFLRANIRYEVRYADAMLGSVDDDILAYIQSRRLEDGTGAFERGIVYAFKRDTVDAVAQVLQASGIPAVAYHAGLSASKRKEAQTSFENGEKPVVVASTAFGMGIDVASIRYVIHHSVPKAVEAFYQESGRAGRDGLPSDSILYYSERDAEFNAFLATKSGYAKEERQLKAAIAALEAMKTYCTSVRCRRVALLDYFGESAKPNRICGSDGCDVCFDRNAVIQRMKVKVSLPSTGFVSAKQVSRLTSPAADFQTAKSMLKMQKSKENKEFGEDREKRRRSVLHDDIDEFSDREDIDPRAKKSLNKLSRTKKPSLALRALARAEEKSEAQRSRLKRPRDRLLARLNGNMQSSEGGQGMKRQKGSFRQTKLFQSAPD